MDYKLQQQLDNIKFIKKNPQTAWSTSEGFWSLYTQILDSEKARVSESLEELGLEKLNGTRACIKDLDKFLLAIKKYNPKLYVLYTEQEVLKL